VQAVLNGVPGKRRFGQFFGGSVDLAGPQRPVGCHERSDHGVLNSARSAPDLALRLRLWPWPSGKRADQQMRADESVAVQECPVFFHSEETKDVSLKQ